MRTADFDGSTVHASLPNLIDLQNNGVDLMKAVFQVLFATFALSLASSTHARRTVDMDFFSISTPLNWQNESLSGRRLLSSKFPGSLKPPMLIIEACRPGGSGRCPSRCDIDSIRRSGMLEDPAVHFTSVARSDGYAEHAAIAQQNTREGIVYSSIRLLCGEAGFIYAVLADTSSAEAVRRDLDVIIGTIEWTRSIVARNVFLETDPRRL